MPLTRVQEKKLVEWLQMAIKFSETMDWDTYAWLLNVASINAIEINGYGAHTEEEVRYAARSVARLIDSMVNRKAARVRPFQVVYHYVTEPLAEPTPIDDPDLPELPDDPEPPLVMGFPQLTTQYFDDPSREGYDASLAAAMAQVMWMLNIRSVGKCSARDCGNYTFTSKRQPKETCSNRCRQKLHRDKRSEAEKRAVHSDRVKRRRAADAKLKKTVKKD